MKQSERSSGIFPSLGTVDAPTRQQAAATTQGGRLVRSTAAELVAADLRARIMSGELAPGAPLRQVALAEELGVSRIPLREAIFLLSSEGLIDLHSHRGAYVSTVSVSEVREFFELRGQLEPWLLGLAIPHIKENDLARAGELVAQMDDATANEWSPLNWHFHEALYLPAAHPHALGIVHTLHEKCERYLNRRNVGAAHRMQAHQEHTEIIEFCRQGNADAASRAMGRHILSSISTLITLSGED
jgi:DNA-binding GntR family transcriptional regulator